jgi:hypothetical protein
MYYLDIKLKKKSITNMKRPNFLKYNLLLI